MLYLMKTATTKKAKKTAAPKKSADERWAEALMKMAEIRYQYPAK